MPGDLKDSNTSEMINANTSIFLGLALIYIYCRGYSSSNASLSFIKGKFKSFCGLLLKLSITTALIYNLCYNFLNLKFNIDRIELEIKETFNQSYRIDYKDYSIDLASLMTYSLRISQLIFTSCIFLAVSLTVPRNSLIKEIYKIDPSLMAYNSSISTFCKLWAVFRIPILFYSAYLRPFLTEKMALFSIIIFSNIEFVLASLFLLLIKFKNIASETKHQADLGLFAISLLAFGLIKYGVNLVDLPFELSQRNLNIVTSVQSALMISIYLFLTDIIFPRKIKDVQQERNLISTEITRPLKFENDVSLVESIIEFDDKKSLIKS